MELWAGMVDVAGAPLGDGGGAYAYCAGEADDLPGFLGRLTAAAAAAGLELKAIDWIARHATLPERVRRSDAVSDVVRDALDSGTVAFDHFHQYPAEDDPEAARLDDLKEQLQEFVGDWFDGAVDAYDEPFTLASYAVIGEFDFGTGTTIGWASVSADEVDLVRRALAAMEG